MLNIIFIHGLESSGHGFKAKLLKNKIPEIITPDFEEYIPGTPNKNLLERRMAQLEKIITGEKSWIIIGSSFGGLMAVLFTCKKSEKVKGLILLAPYLNSPELNPKHFSGLPLNIPVFIFHARNDLVVPMKPSKARAEKIFSNIEYHIIENDDHKLESTVQKMDWNDLINKIENP
jgi:pimeloyl-ACP methyl ester carboxylesterase